MIICSPISTCVKSGIYLTERLQRQMSSTMCMVSHLPRTSHCLYVHAAHLEQGYISMPISKNTSGSPLINFQPFRRNFLRSAIYGPKDDWQALTKRNINGSQSTKRAVGFSFFCQNLNVRMLDQKRRILSRIKFSVPRMSWPQGFASAFFFGLLVSLTRSRLAYAEAACLKVDKNHSSSISHGKKVLQDYSVTGIPGDGRCLFRSVVHGACLRSGKPAPNESFQRELADELRARVADEFVKRREETEWFIEGDFDTYVSKIRKPHVWGGEPELLMASHVLQMPITVYMHDDEAKGLISIAEYGQEYGKENPVRVLYHGSGHYDALQIPGMGFKARI